MKPVFSPDGPDLDYLRRCKRSTPAQRLAWLAGALGFTRTIRKPATRRKA